MPFGHFIFSLIQFKPWIRHKYRRSPHNHFTIHKCEKPFLGNRHYERKGLAYCATHYHQVAPDTYSVKLCQKDSKFLKPCSLISKQDDNFTTEAQHLQENIWIPALWKSVPPLRRGDRGGRVHRPQQGDSELSWIEPSVPTPSKMWCRLEVDMAGELLWWWYWWLVKSRSRKWISVTQGMVQKPLCLLSVRYSDGAEDKVLWGGI